MTLVPVPVTNTCLRGIRYACLFGAVLWAALGLAAWALWG